jgi:hypothetical protein
MQTRILLMTFTRDQLISPSSVDAEHLPRFTGELLPKATSDHGYAPTLAGSSEKSTQCIWDDEYARRMPNTHLQSYLPIRSCKGDFDSFLVSSS